MRVVKVSGNSDDSILDGFSDVCLSDFLHLEENHGRDFFSFELLGLSLVIYDDHWLVFGTSLNFEGPKLNVSLHVFVLELTADKTLGVVDSISWVFGGLVLGSITDETLLLSEGNVRGGGVETLIVGDDLNFAVLEDTDAGVGGSEIDTDGYVGHFVFVVLNISVLY